MKTSRLHPRWPRVAAAAAAALLATVPATMRAQSLQAGPYAIAAVGLSHVNYDCGIYLSCSSAKTTTGKFIGGYRFGVFALEGWLADYGSAEVGDVWRGPSTLRIRGVGASAAWYLHFGDTWHGLLRAGLGQITQTRTDDGRKAVGSGMFGLGVIKEFTPAMALELAWDITGSEGNQTSSSLVNVASVGLRVRF